MFPAVPAPGGGKIRVPVEVKLEPGWHYDKDRREFVSDDGESFKPAGELPRAAKIVPKVPAAPRAAKLTPAQRELARYAQVILPPGESAADYLEMVRAWPCITEAHVGAEISLP